MEPRQQNLPVSPAEPTDAELWKDRGNKAFSAKNYAQAKQDYTQSIALQPTCLAYANRAMAELKLEEHSAAEADCTKAIALDAAYVKAYLRRGSAARQLGKLLEATEDYEHALRLEPTSKSTLAERRACLDQLLAQEGLPSQPLRAAIRTNHHSAQASAANPSTNATLGAPSSTAQPGGSTQMQPRTSQVSNSSSHQAKLVQSQQNMCTHGSSTGTHGALPKQSEPSMSQQKPGSSGRPSAAKPAEQPQQSKPSTVAKQPGSVSRQKPSSNREGLPSSNREDQPSSNTERQPSSSQVPLPGMHTHTRSTYGLAAQRRRAEPSVIIQEVLSEEDDLPSTTLQGNKKLHAPMHKQCMHKSSRLCPFHVEVHMTPRLFLEPSAFKAHHTLPTTNTNGFR